MAVSRIRGSSVEDYLDALRKNAEEVWDSELKLRLSELCGELASVAEKLEGRPEHEQDLVRRLDELQASLASCDAAGEKGIRCLPFYERAVLVIEECRHL